MNQYLLALSLLGGGIVPLCQAQTLAALNPLNPANAGQGLRLYGISSFFGYYSYDFPLDPNVKPTRGDGTYGVAGTLGWGHFRARTNISLLYGGAFTAGLQASRTSRVGQNVSLALNRAFGQKWSLDVSLTGQDATYHNFIFVPTSLGTLAQSSATTEDLAAAMSVGKFSSSTNSLLLTGTLGGASPTQAVLLGGHVLTYSGRVGLSFAPTTRLSFRFSSFASGGEHRTSDPITGARLNYVMPHTLGGDAGVAMDYQLSPRTSISVTAVQNYVSNTYSKSSGSTFSMGFGRRMGRRWFLRSYGGAYFVRQGEVVPQSRQFVGGATLGFTTYGNTFIATYSRTGYDATAGLGGMNSMMSGAWNWRRPRSSWSFYATYSRVQNTTEGASSISGWQVAGGYMQRLGAGLFVSATYTYLDSRGAYLSISNAVRVTGTRVTLGWSPGNGRRSGLDASTPEESK